MSAKNRKPVNPAFVACRDIYFNWFDVNFPYAPIFTAADGDALNKMLDWLARSFEKKVKRTPLVQELIDSFKLIFDNYEFWGYWHGKAKRMTTVFYGIQDITDSIKSNRKNVFRDKKTATEFNGKPVIGNSSTDARAYHIMQKHRDKKMGTSDKC